MATRRGGSPAIREKATLSPNQMVAAVERLGSRVEELKAFDPSQISSSTDPHIKALEQAIERSVSSIFGPESHDYAQLTAAWHLDKTDYFLSLNSDRDTTLQDVREGFAKGKANAIALLSQVISSLQEEIKYSAPIENRTETQTTKPAALSAEVFVVHGHDDRARLEVCALLSKANLKPIVLHEQASSGRTVIEKLEHYSDVSFAVVILTPDDVGGPKGGEMQPRARQNVIAELFYFIGKLTRARVCALMKGGIESPSDIGGIVYVQLDDHGGWKTALLRELDDAGYKFDWAKALR